MRPRLQLLGYSLLALLPAPALAGAQGRGSVPNVREAQAVGQTQTDLDLAIFSRLNLSMLGYVSSRQVKYSLADSAGSFGAAQRLDLDPSGAPKRLQEDSLFIEDAAEEMTAIWEDERSGRNQLVYRQSLDGGLTWGPELVVPTGPGQPAVREWAAARFVEAAALETSVAMTVEASNGKADLVYSRTVGGGSSFLPAIRVSVSTTPGVADRKNPALVHDPLAGTLHLAWKDDRTSGMDDVWYQRSADGGFTWVATDRRLDGSGPGNGEATGGLSLDAYNNVVVAAWGEKLNGSTTEELRVIASSTGGQSFFSDRRWGRYDPFFDTVRDPVVFVQDDLTQGRRWIFASWSDDRFGGSDVFVARSDDFAASHVETQLSPVGFQAKDPLLAGDRNGGHAACLFQKQVPGGPHIMASALSRNSGASWSPAFAFFNTGLGSVNHELKFGAAWNDAYHNVVGTWASDRQGSEQVFAGGFRPQSVALVGTPRPGSTVSFDLYNFPQEATGQTCGVLVAGSLGGYLLPGSTLSTGLAKDQALLLTLQMSELRGTIDAGGNGATASVVYPNVPVGKVFYAVGIGDPFAQDGGPYVTDTQSFQTSP